jgi:hypothetical protein
MALPNGAAPGPVGGHSGTCRIRTRTLGERFDDTPLVRTEYIISITPAPVPPVHQPIKWLVIHRINLPHFTFIDLLRNQHHPATLSEEHSTLLLQSPVLLLHPSTMLTR